MKLKWFSAGLFFILFSTLLFLSCGKDSDSNDNAGGNNNPPPSGTNEQVVSINNMSFGSSPLTVRAGTTVIWVNDDDMSHTVTSDNGTFSSGTLRTDESFRYKFNTAGNYPYHCNLHAGMRASVTVNQ